MNASTGIKCQNCGRPATRHGLCECGNPVWSTPITRLENMRQFLLEYGVNPEKEPVNTVMFHLMSAEREREEIKRQWQIACQMAADAANQRDEARREAENIRDSLIRHEWSKPIVFPWENSQADPPR